MPNEKLLLKKTLFDELKKTNDEIKKLEQNVSEKFADVKVIYAKISCLKSHKEFVQRLIDICVNRNKF